MILKKGNPVLPLIFIVSISAFAFFLLITGFIGKTVAEELQEKIGITQEINDSLQTTITTSTVTLNTLWYILFAGLLLGLFVAAQMTTEYPKVMVPIFILTLIITTLIAIVMANAYDEVVSTADLGTMSAYQNGIYFAMVNLPYIAILVGIVGIVIIFTRDSGVGGGGGVIN